MIAFFRRNKDLKAQVESLRAENRRLQDTIRANTQDLMKGSAETLQHRHWLQQMATTLHNNDLPMPDAVRAAYIGLKLSPAPLFKQTRVASRHDADFRRGWRDNRPPPAGGSVHLDRTTATSDNGLSDAILYGMVGSMLTSDPPSSSPAQESCRASAPPAFESGGGGDYGGGGSSGSWDSSSSSSDSGSSDSSSSSSSSD